MKLYFVELAPNPTRVRLYIAEKIAGGAPLEITEVRVKLMKGEHRLPEHVARSPFATVPVLELVPGDYIVESLSIMQYFEDMFPEPSLSGGSLRERAKLRDLERIAELRVLIPMGRFVHATNSPIGLPVSEDIAHQASQTFAEGLSFFDNVLADGRSFIGGSKLSMSDCTLAAALHFGRFGGIEIDPALVHLNRWDTAFRRRAAVQRILSP